MGAVTIGKLRDAGGRVDVATCTAQLLYEVDDPASYVTPDCVLDLSQVRLAGAGQDLVAVSGARARPRTPTYKVSVGYFDGYLGEGQLSYGGPNAVARARLAGDVVAVREILAVQSVLLPRALVRPRVELVEAARCSRCATSPMPAPATRGMGSPSRSPPLLARPLPKSPRRQIIPYLECDHAISPPDVVGGKQPHQSAQRNPDNPNPPVTSIPHRYQTEPGARHQQTPTAESSQTASAQTAAPQRVASFRRRGPFLPPPSSVSRRRHPHTRFAPRSPISANLCARVMFQGAPAAETGSDEAVQATLSEISSPSPGIRTSNAEDSAMRNTSPGNKLTLMLPPRVTRGLTGTLHLSPHGSRYGNAYTVPRCVHENNRNLNIAGPCSTSGSFHAARISGAGSPPVSRSTSIELRLGETCRRAASIHPPRPPCPRVMCQNRSVE